MRHAAFAALIPILLALPGCEKGPPNPLAMAPISILDVDRSFILGLLRDQVSTRDAAKPDARFVLDGIETSGSGSSRHATSFFIEPATGCRYSLRYRAPSTPGPGSPLPGAPLADPSIANYDPLKSSWEDSVDLEGSGQACAEAAVRPELAAARAKARSLDPALVRNKAFAAALPELRKAADPSAAQDPDARFALTAKSTRAGSTEYAFIERSTGCQWTANSASDKVLTPLSIEPASCVAALAGR